MNDYYRVRVQANPCTADITDLAAAFMADAGFESFEPDSEGLTAYISVKVGDGTTVATEALADFPWTPSLISVQNLWRGKIGTKSGRNITSNR